MRELIEEAAMYSLYIIMSPHGGNHFDDDCNTAMLYWFRVQLKWGM